jgi:phosphatidylglycerophosphatase A
MTVKESSDELNLNATTADEAVASPRAARSAKDYLALAIATCGVGYLPLAPGTWGSLLALGVYLVWRTVVSAAPPDTFPRLRPHEFLSYQIIVIVTMTLVGIWAASVSERVFRLKDPGKVVVDEVAGQLIALLPLSNTWDRPAPALVILAFLSFRFFDIVKPYPARKLESLHGGLGIMLDDVVAGVYAAVVVAVAVVASRYI